MCYACWTKLGRPAAVTPKIIAAAELVDDLYGLAPVGGNLHIVTDDWNIEDDHVRSCRENVSRIQQGKTEQYDDTDPEQISIEASILDAIEPMSEAERATVLAVYLGFIDLPG